MRFLNRMIGAILSCCVVAFAGFSGLAQAAASLKQPEPSGSVGVQTIMTNNAMRSDPVAVSIWYPADKAGATTMIGGNAVFDGVSAIPDAGFANGKFPAVLIAHGGMRSAPHLSDWIAHDLAMAGYVAIVVRPPKIAPDRAGDAVAEIWLRPQDYVATLVSVKGDARFNDHIDPDRIGFLGFQLGGTSALMLAGARLDPNAFAASCDTGGTGIDCGWFGKNGIDLHKVDAAATAQDHHNIDLATVIAVDPELTTSFDRQTLGAIILPISVINLGKPGDIHPGLDASALAQIIPDARYQTIDAASRFSAFATCTPKAVMILREDGDDGAICMDGGDVNRVDIHADLAARITAALQHGFAPTN